MVVLYYWRESFWILWGQAPTSPIVFAIHLAFSRKYATASLNMMVSTKELLPSLGRTLPMLVFLSAGVFSAGVSAGVSPVSEMRDSPVKYKLRFTENFSGEKLNTKLWQRIPAGKPDWNRNMSLRDDLVSIKDGILTIRGIRNDGRDPQDVRAVLTGGIMTKDRFTMQYGKVEFRMKLGDGPKGAWPAVWMMPQTTVRGWPNDGEIDIVERLNNDAFVYQTLHYGDGTGRDLMHGGRGPIRNGEWNVYGFEWTPDELVWTVNGKRTHSWKKRPGDDELKHPWVTPYYIMFDMQLGGSWVGSVDIGALPAAMHVDWVKFYEAKQNGKTLGGFARPRPPGM